MVPAQAFVLRCSSCLPVKGKVPAICLVVVLRCLAMSYAWHLVVLDGRLLKEQIHAKGGLNFSAFLALMSWMG